MTLSGKTTCSFKLASRRVGRAVRTQRWKYGVVAENADAWNDMNAERYTEAYLYDLQVDPV